MIDLRINDREASLVDLARLALKPWLCACGQLNRGKDLRCTKGGCNHPRPSPQEDT